MTVEEWFAKENITKDHVVLIAEESDYWDKSSRFVVGNWQNDVNLLSEKQASWLTRIYEDLVELKIEGRGLFRR